MTSETQPPPEFERTGLSGALFGFYASCTGVGIGVTIAASSLIVFGDEPGSTTIASVSIAVAAVCSILAWWTLRRARGDR